MFPKWFQLSSLWLKRFQTLEQIYAGCPRRPFVGVGLKNSPERQAFIFSHWLGKYFAAALHHINLTASMLRHFVSKQCFTRAWAQRWPGADLKWTRVPNTHSPAPLYTSWHRLQAGFCQKLPEKVAFHSSQLKGTLDDKYLLHLITETVSKPMEKD